MKIGVPSLAYGMFIGLATGNLVEIRHRVTVEHVDSAEWIDVGFFNLYRFSEAQPDLEITLLWNGMA
ncbi:MAG: hypothetical protein ACON5H_11815 [Akkermansiaceae bacterium]